MSSRQPFNLKLLRLNPADLRLMSPVRSLDMFDGAGSTNFHPEGLFSTSIFGRVGDPDRDQRFSYIPLKTGVLHPKVFELLERTKRLYVGILSGKEYARWDDQLKDWVGASEVTGETGYQTFMSRWQGLKIAKSESPVRNQRVELLDKYRQESVNEYLAVMPAGLRDAEVDNLGRVQQHEINTHYMRVLNITNTIAKTSSGDSPLLDTARWALQQGFNAIYENIIQALEGKHGILQAKWGGRRTMDGTRNVISAIDISSASLDDPYAPGPDDTVVGLWQLTRGVLPVAVHYLKNRYLDGIFGNADGKVRLIDTKTLKGEYVSLNPRTFDRWTTREGLEKVLASQGMLEARSRPVKVQGRYLALVYKPKDTKVFKVFHDIDELPDWADRKDVYPITLMELIYLSGYQHWNRFKAMITRYPVAGEGSTYVSNVFLRTTVKSEPRRELGEEWQMLEGDEHIASVFPLFDPEKYIDSAMVHLYRLAGLFGDFDGDTVSVNFLYTQEAIDEVSKYYLTRGAYVDPAGGLRASAAIDTVELVMHNMSGD